MLVNPKIPGEPLEIGEEMRYSINVYMSEAFGKLKFVLITDFIRGSRRVLKHFFFCRD